MSISDHPDDTALSWVEVLDAMAALSGSRVAVRVIEHSETEILVSVLRGNLGKEAGSKQPALFWPITGESEQVPGDEEESGLYLHEERFGGAVGRAGNSILAVVQGAVLVNIRRS